MLYPEMSGPEFKGKRLSMGLSQPFVAQRILNNDGEPLASKTLSHWELTRIEMPSDAIEVIAHCEKQTEAITDFITNDAIATAAQTEKIAYITAFRDETALHTFGPDLGDMTGMGPDAFSICITNATYDLANLTPDIPTWVVMFESQSYVEFLAQSQSIHSPLNLALWAQQKVLQHVGTPLGVLH